MEALQLPRRLPPKFAVEDDAPLAGSPQSRPPSRDRALREDKAVMGTNDDAAASKLSAVDKGYYKDAFLSYFVRSRTRRPPLINRGYYSRVAAMRKLLDNFFVSSLLIEPDSSSQRRQVVSLGAGSDTTYFHYKAAQQIDANTVFFEFDFPDVVRSKMRVIQESPALLEQINQGNSNNVQADQASAQMHAPTYHLMGVDLRRLDDLQKLFSDAGGQMNVPTVFISECVLIYLKPEESNAIIRWAATFDPAVFITYEQILPDDAFGQVMLRNLEQRNVALHGIRARPDIPAQQQSYLSSGWERADALDMNDIYDDYLDQTETRRIARVELFDELEEWHLIQAHYCIVCAVRDTKRATSLLPNLRLVKSNSKFIA